MDSKYSVGDKVFTADTWNNGMGLVIPKGSIVEIRRIYEYDGVNMCDCIYDTDKDSVIYDERSLGEIYINTGKWIYCEQKKYPEDLEDVILYCKHNSDEGTFYDYRIGHKIKEMWFINGCGKKTEVIAWHTIPQITKE